MKKSDQEVFRLNVVSVRLVKDAPILSGHPVKSPEDAVELIGNELCQLDREVVCILHLKADGKPISCTFATKGALDSSIAHPRELLKAAILSNASGMIMIHNHPSGNISCSVEDTIITQRMIDICELVGIRLLDSIIVGGDNREYFSFKEKDRLPQPHRNICTDYQQVEFKMPVAAEISSYLDGTGGAKEKEMLRDKPSGKTPGTKGKTENRGGRKR